MSSRPAVRQLGRISEIAQVAAKHGFGYLFQTRGIGGVRSRRGREVELDGGGRVTSTDAGEGPVAVSIYPWEIAIEPGGDEPHGSTQNHLAAEVLSVTTVGNRVRVSLAGAQPVAAEITLASAERLGLRDGLAAAMAPTRQPSSSPRQHAERGGVLPSSRRVP